MVFIGLLSCTTGHIIIHMPDKYKCYFYGILSAAGNFFGKDSLIKTKKSIDLFTPVGV